ncbi:hypothetical protein L0U85_03040 [Glycomyces sp. L485]|uniref:hypothetical protein n=1 Tax=Glycomyces sp. L485 TaxID=2909235 RepID=UPI001F4AE21A|nr:hypothetical protein [Glycomyces sp. L485]MCH7229839.1 hypothetical protein [Glycomyces sp. L485]
MIIRSRLRVSLVLALALILAAGLVTADPAAARADGDELVPAGESELGAMLETRYESQPDGYLKITEYEGGTEVVGVLAGCILTSIAYKPRKSTSGRIRGSGYYKISGCGSSPFTVTLSVKAHSYRDLWDTLTSWSFRTYPPTSGKVSTSTSCQKGTVATELLIKRNSTEHWHRSASLYVTSC